MKAKITAIFLCAALLLSASLSLTGCGIVTSVEATDLMKDVTPRNFGEPGPVGDADGSAAAEFAVRLFRACSDGKNILVSPLSVLSALSMTTNGAKGETLAQMEKVLGMKKDELNSFIRSYMNALEPTEKCKLSLANAIWFTDDAGFSVDRDFLRTNADYYGADAYRSPFDRGTVNQINDWVKKNTDGMIPEIIETLRPDDVMVLVNALAFDAEWDEIYRTDQVNEGEFTLDDGTKKTATFMYSEEGAYLKDKNATGFIKYYKGGRFAFAAMLPNEGVTLDEYIATLDGASLRKTLEDAKSTEVYAAIPKFESEYGKELKDVLIAMGMEKAFTADADFSGLGTCEAGPVMIGSVLHKTFISVNEKGTRAGASTAVVNKCGSALCDTETVYLDRPFIYMLIDTETNLPFFIGALTDVG